MNQELKTYEVEKVYFESHGQLYLVEMLYEVARLYRVSSCGSEISISFGEAEHAESMIGVHCGWTAIETFHSARN